MWFGRGGYGSNRILTRIMPQLGTAAAAKRYCGYSDMGFVLGALLRAADRAGRARADGDRLRRARGGGGDDRALAATG